MNIFRFLPLVPEQASEHAARYDLLYWVITILSGVFTLIVAVLVLTLATRYRRGSKANRANPIDHHNGLELLWTVVPLVLAMAIFGWSTYNFVNYQRRMPKDALEVYVIGKRWMWHLQHMNGIRENNELHIPIGTPIKMTMISQDVIHAMFLPEFRAQYHVVPGRYTEIAFTPIKTGRFKMLCAMHCGTKHSEMVGYVHVLSKAEFAKWLENGGRRNAPVPLTMVEKGRQIWAEKNCGNCHTNVDNVRAPTLRAIGGTKRTMVDGTTVTADRTYLRDSILKPYRMVTKGYEPNMQSYEGNLSEEDVLALVAYIDSLGQPAGSKPGPYEPAPAATRSLSTADDNATDVTNKFASPGAAQNRTGGSKQ